MTQQMQAGRASLSVTHDHRPGLVTFAAVMMFVVSAFLVVVAISEWADSVWLYQRNFNVVGNHLIFWGFVDFVIAAVSAYGAFMLLAGRRSGQVLTLIFAGISAVRWLFYIPADPWLAIAILVIDTMIIYGLTAHDEWFATGTITRYAK